MMHRLLERNFNSGKIHTILVVLFCINITNGKKENVYFVSVAMLYGYRLDVICNEFNGQSIVPNNRFSGLSIGSVKLIASIFNSL